MLKLALPKGRLLEDTAAMLSTAGWDVAGYSARARSYRLRAALFPEMQIKVFHEKDIPVQVAVGNYDLGICGRDWVEELMAKYRSSALVKVKELEYGRRLLQMVAGGASGINEIINRGGTVRIVSEYPNMAEAYAVRYRLRKFSVMPVWGATEAYPPESADLALIAAGDENELAAFGLVSVSKAIESRAFVIANRHSWEEKDMQAVLSSLGGNGIAGEGRAENGVPEMAPVTMSATAEEEEQDAIWLALPDGHQQQYAVKLLNQAGIKVNDYPSPSGNRRPTTDLEGVRIKVIRPQDMPQQVANGNFNLAITGRDWLREHLYQFPTSPVVELADLKYGKVKIVAVVSNGMAVEDARGLRQLNGERETPFRVASEYVNIADKFARDNHLGWYRVVPTWGASEGFLPEDADCLIENTETGSTISRHKLKIIDTLFVSTACLIGRKDDGADGNKGKRISAIIARLRKATEEPD